MPANDPAHQVSFAEPRRPSAHYEPSARRMVHSLIMELLAEEESTVRRSAGDAARYEGVEPGGTFCALHAHATAGLRRLSALARNRGLARTRSTRFLRMLVGRARDLCRERFETAERAYRTTVSRARDGLDIVRLLRIAADGADDTELLSFCDEWLAPRLALVETLTKQVEWFADRPRVSMETAHAIAVARQRLRAERNCATQRGAMPRALAAAIGRVRT